MIKSVFLALIMISLSIVVCFTQDLITDRPDQTESSSSVPKKRLRWESGFSIVNFSYDRDLYFTVESIGQAYPPIKLIIFNILS